MSRARRRSRSNRFGFDEQGFTGALRGSHRSLVQDDRIRSERDAEPPLFISDPYGRPRPEEYAEHDENDCSPLKSRSAIPRLMMTALAIAALGGALVTFHTQIAGSIQDAVSGKASATPVAASDASSTLSAEDIAAIPPGRPGKDQAPLGAPIIQPRTEAALPLVPSRETMKAAYQSALQAQPQIALRPAPDPEVQPAQIRASQIEVASPLPTPPASPPPAKDRVYRLAPDQIALMIRRGDDLVASGDVAAARLVLHRAAEAGDARAMIKLGATYDPALLSRIDNHGVAPDLVSARIWYAKAAELGAPEARRRLEALAATQPESPGGPSGFATPNHGTSVGDAATRRQD